MAFQLGIKKEEESKDSSFKTASKEDWMTKKWRPMMAIMYMICCIVDFVIFPIMFTIVQFWETQAVNDAFRQWVPITLQSGGLFHVAMGAVLGVTAFGRTQEKIAGVNGGTPTPTLNSTSPPMSSQYQMNGYASPPPATQRSVPSYNPDPYVSNTNPSPAGAPNLARIRQLDPNNVFERG